MAKRHSWKIILQQLFHNYWFLKKQFFKLRTGLKSQSISFASCSKSAIIQRNECFEGGKFFGKVFIIFSITFGLWAKNFWTFGKKIFGRVQNCILRVQKNILRNFFSKLLKFFYYIRNLSKKYSDSRQKIFRRVIRTPFYVSWGTFSRKIFFLSQTWTNFGQHRLA